MQENENLHAGGTAARVAGLGPEDVLHFWFDDLTPTDWFNPQPALDGRITARFRVLYEQLREDVPVGWLQTPRGTLAAIIVLDQFPRNMFRGAAQAFATDAEALAIAKAGIKAGRDTPLSDIERQFFYLPFEHSEDAEDQARSVALAGGLATDAIEWATRHKAVVDRFGRFPSRNAALERKTTNEEAQFLTEYPHGF